MENENFLAALINDINLCVNFYKSYIDYDIIDVLALSRKYGLTQEAILDIIQRLYEIWLCGFSNGYSA